MSSFDLDRMVTIFGIIVVVLFLILGGLVIFSRMFDYIPKSYRVIFGTLIILYGAFRLVLLYNKSRNEE